jgi:hypothetical protein
MSDYAERFVSAFVSKKSGAIELRRVESGGYAADESGELATVMAEAKKPVSNWAIWDATDAAPKERREVPYSANEFRKLLNSVEPEEVAIVWCKRGKFRAPVLKIGSIKSMAAGERQPRQSTRIGK